ncbi:MAG: methyltransferase domain-containing protein [Verrucomicrobia bacterium]|nr:MAG: methyltransferase domain-containing protein [Verrucomicrobiota bacterium]
MLDVIKRLRHILGSSLRFAGGMKSSKNDASSTPRDASLDLIGSLIASGEPIKLEIGAGTKKGAQGWLTSDQCPGADLMMDLLKPFPFPDNTVSKIYSSHVLEHFYTDQLKFVLGECRRVLKPGGMMSACVPDAGLYVAAYLHPEAFDAEKYCKYKPGYNFYSSIDYLNYIAYMGGHHRHMFDMENLLTILSESGFRNGRARKFDPELDLANRDDESIYAECEK